MVQSTFCFPHFDSPTIFAALLDHARGGRFQIAPQLADTHQKQLYLPDSNILLTRFLAPEGVAEISDFMPVEEVEQAHNLVRRVKTVRGELCFRMLCAPRFDYGRASHRVEQQAGTVLFSSEGNDGTALRLHSSVPLRIHNGDAIAEFTLRPDEHAEFVLEWAHPGSLASDSTRLCLALLQGYGQFLAALDWALELPGPLAGDGQPRRAHAQAPRLSALRFIGRSTNLRPA